MAVYGIDGHRRGKLEEREESVSSERADVGRDGRAVEPNFQVRLETGKVHYSMVCFRFFPAFFSRYFSFFLVVIPFIPDVRLQLSVNMWRTSRGHTGGRPHWSFFPSSPPSFCSACFNFLSREGFSRSFPSSNVKSNFVYP